MRRQHRSRRAAVGVAIALVLVVGCQQEGPQAPVAGASVDVVAATPKVETLDLAAVEKALAGAADADQALASLATLDNALKTPGAIPAESEAKARELRNSAAFALVVQAALGTADLAKVATGLNLGEPAKTATGALQALAVDFGGDTPVGKAAALLAWLAAKPEERPGLGAPTLGDWAALAADSSAAGVAVRAATLEALTKLQAGATDKAGAARLDAVAGALGPLACAKCTDLASTPAEGRAALVYTPDNLGFVCEKAAAALAGKAPFAYPAALAAACAPEDFALADADALRVLTAGNAILLRPFVLAARAAEPGTGSLAAVHDAKAKAAATAFGDKLLPLALPWLPVPPADAEALAADVVPPFHVSETGLQRAEPPLETVVVDEKGVAIALRPIASLADRRITLEDRTRELGWPGRQVIAVDKVEEADTKRDEAAKAAGEKVADKDVLADVVTGLQTLAEQAGPLEARAFSEAAKPVLNTTRGATDRTALVAVDGASPAWLLRRTLASMTAAGYTKMLFPKASAADLSGTTVLPLVFRTAEGLPPEVAVQTHQRPVLVWVREKDVQVFPPDKRTAPKSEGERPKAAAGWPEGAREVLDDEKKLFAVRVGMPDKAEEAVGATVAAVVRKLELDNDAGNVVYVIAQQDALSGRVLEVADALSSMEGTPVTQVAGLEAGLVCDGATCPTHVAVLFPDVRPPRLPGAPVIEVERPKKPDPKAASGPPGFCEKGNIQRVVSARSGSFRFCYEKELQLQPDLAGKLTVRFTIGTDGGTYNASLVESTVRNRKVEQCVLKTFSGMRFDKPRGGVCVVTWPLKFQH